jgi:hypothetical protein
MAGLRYLVLSGIGALAFAASCSDDEDTSSKSTVVASSVQASSVSSTAASTGPGGCGQTTNLNLTCAGVTTNATETECHVLNQDCPAGFTCDILAGATACVPDAGGVKCKGDTCTADSECQAGLKCVDSKCTAFCCPTDHQPCGSGFCVITVDFGGTTTGQMCAYPPQCTLLEDNCPDANTNCYPLRPEDAFAGCFPRSDTPADEGEPCAFTNDCDESTVCDNVCLQLCDVANWMNETVPTGGCPPGRVCQPYTWPPSNTEWSNIGVCRPMGGNGGAGGN